MSSLRNDVYSALTTSGGLTVYPNEAPQDAVYPLVVYAFVAGHDEVYLDGYSQLVQRLVQVDCYANDPDTADSMMATVKTRLGASSAFKVGAVDLSGADPFDTDARMYRTSYEFSIWANV